MSNWKPISEAPKNGTPIMVIGGHFESAGSENVPMIVQWFSFADDENDPEGKWTSVHYSCSWAVALNPTHYMELPKPPIEEGK